jgi:hypothetical protein
MDPEEEYDPLAYCEKLDRFLNGEEQTTLFFELEKQGWTPPFAETMTDEELTRALTDLIWGIWDLGVVIEDTDHLSDRELYLELLDYCDEPTVVFPEEPDAWCHWSPIGSGSEPDTLLWLRYYCDERSRANWMEQVPDYEMPPMELPAHYRSWLPQRTGLRD